MKGIRRRVTRKESLERTCANAGGWSRLAFRMGLSSLKVGELKGKLCVWTEEGE